MYDAAGAATTAVNAITATGSNGVSASASNGAITVSGTAATNAAAGVIKIATDAEATTGTAENIAVNPKQLKVVSDAVAGLNSTYATDAEVATLLESYSTTTEANALYDAAGAATTAVNALTYAGASGGNVITQVTQTNGTVSATMGKAAMEPASWASDTDGTYVLTASKSGDVITYHWENINRGN